MAYSIFFFTNMALKKQLPEYCGLKIKLPKAKYIEPQPVEDLSLLNTFPHRNHTTWMKQCQTINLSFTTAAFYYLSQLKGNELKTLEASVLFFLRTQMRWHSRAKLDSPDRFLLACSPYLNPKSLQTSSLWSSCSVHCDWTWHLRWRIWSLRRTSDCLDLLAPRTLNRSSGKEKKMSVCIKT